MTTAFDLPARLAAKADPSLIAVDERHFAAIGASLQRSVADLAARLDEERLRAGGEGQASLDRDLEVHRLSARLSVLRRYGLDLCLGRIVLAGDPEPVYIGRQALSDSDGSRLLIDWRAPAAEPFFAATRANPQGLASRRRYRWANGRIVDYWDEAFTDDAESSAALDDESAFIASLGASRSPRMRDVLSTIQADQDAIIRDSSRGALVVDGGPGTGKTVVALHRTAYLLYADPRLDRSRGGVLVVGPSNPYLAYIEDVLPGLGEEGVQTCTLRDLVPEGAAAAPAADPEADALKASGPLVRAIEGAIQQYEQPLAQALELTTPWGGVTVWPSEWEEAFDAPDPGTPHNDARGVVWDELLAILVDKLSEAAPEQQVRRALARDEELRAVFTRAWPLLDPVAFVAALWTSPSLLHRVAPSLTDDEVAALQRPDPRAWTVADLPLLDAARQRIGDPDAERRRREREAALAAEREQRDAVMENLIAGDDSEMLVMTMLSGQDFANSLVDEAALPQVDPDALAGPFAHIVVDEAQELTDAEWLMLLRRCPSRSFTVVGDRAQARHGFRETWQQRLTRIGLRDNRVSTLTINYRTPEEVMAEAAPVILAALPDANVPTAVRSSGIPVRHGSRAELDGIVDAWVAAHPDGVACVIGDASFPPRPRVASLAPELAKGLEFDLVVLVDPERFGDGVQGAVDRYVAMTRATQQLVVLTT